MFKTNLYDEKFHGSPTGGIEILEEFDKSNRTLHNLV